MSGLQTLKTAFWSLAVSLGVLSLLFIFCPQVTGPVIALFRSPVQTGPGAEEPGANEMLAGQPDADWHFPDMNEGEFPQPSATQDGPRLKTSQVADDAEEFEQFVASQQAARTESSPLDPVAKPVPQPEINEELSRRLASLQAAIDRLVKAEADRKTAQNERAAERLEHRRQTERLRELEQQLQSLQTKQLEAISNIQSVADEKSPPVVLPEENMPAPTAEPVVDDDNKRFTLVLRSAEITDVLEVLGQETGYNIVVGEGVGGTVQTAKLRDVTIDAALDNIVGPNGLVFERDGQFIYVMTEAEQLARKSSAATKTAGRDGPTAQ